MNTIRLFSSIVTLGLCSGSLGAVDTLKFGAQAGVAMPENNAYQGTGISNKAGFGLGAHCFIGLKDAHALVPRLDVMKFDNNGTMGGSSTIGVKTTTLSLGADYQYHFSESAGNRGFYVFGGARYSSNKQEISLKISGLPNVTTSSTVNGPGFSGGCGYLLTSNLGGEVRLSQGNLGTAGHLFELSIYFRF